MYGRWEIHPDDVLAVRYGLCVAGDATERTRFDEIATPIVDEARKQRGSEIDAVERELLMGFREQIPEVADTVSDAEREALRVQLDTLAADVAEVRVSLPTTDELQRAVLGDIAARRVRLGAAATKTPST
jgi:hypothetical protein